MVWRRRMTPQVPAEGILKTNEWGDSKVYKIVCECTDSQHDHNLWVEADEHEISVTIYATVKSNFWTKTRWYHIWSLLSKGYVDTETTLIMRKQGALNYAETLKLAIEDVEDFRKKNEQNKNS
jgi:hypothetical protein